MNFLLYTNDMNKDDNKGLMSLSELYANNFYVNCFSLFQTYSLSFDGTPLCFNAEINVYLVMQFEVIYF